MDEHELLLRLRDRYPHDELIDKLLFADAEPVEFKGDGRVLGEQEAKKKIIADELTDFWLDLAHAEIEALVPKAVEYGAADLEVMGNAMQMLLPEQKRSRELGLEMAIGFYALGKVARLFGSYERAEKASDDTWHDLGVYCRMAQKVRRTGKWV